MRFIDLCTGIGGFSLGLTWAGMTCVGQVEIDTYCNKILQKHWPEVMRWQDIKTLDPRELPATDLICGGYPCQPFSLAGKRGGADDDRHLWPYVSSIIGHVKPAWCLFENVAGHISMGLDEVLSDLENQGYTAQPLVIPACAVNAPHRRDRVWIVAWNANGAVKHKRTVREVFGDKQGSDATGVCQSVSPNANGKRISKCREEIHCIEKRENCATGEERRAYVRPETGGHSDEVLSDTNSQRRQERDIAAVNGKAGRLDGSFAQGVLPDNGERQYGLGDRRETEIIETAEIGSYLTRRNALDDIGEWWNSESGLGRVADGVPRRVDRLRALGNAVVPQVVYMIGAAIMEASNETP